MKVTKSNLIEYGLRLEHILKRKANADPNQVIQILNLLKSIDIDPKLIHNCDMIMTINNLRRFIPNQEVVKLSNGLLKSWKKAVIDSNSELKEILVKKTSPVKSGQSLETQKTFKAIAWADSEVFDETKKLRFKKYFNKELSVGTSDPIRVKSRDLLTNAMLDPDDGPKEIIRVARIAIQIERNIYKEFGNSGSKYKIRLRSRISNLSDEGNTQLRERVLNGTISPERIAVMTTEELATDRMRRLRQRYTEEAMIENQLPVVYGTTTELLKCPKCKKNHCTYNQVQIDRADEPMTTHCLCISCGHRWKFN